MGYLVLILCYRVNVIILFHYYIASNNKPVNDIPLQKYF